MKREKIAATAVVAALLLLALANTASAEHLTMGRDHKGLAYWYDPADVSLNEPPKVLMKESRTPEQKTNRYFSGSKGTKVTDNAGNVAYGTGLSSNPIRFPKAR